MENNVIFDLVLLEADRVLAHRMKNFDLYYKDIHGSFQEIGEGYSKEVEDVMTSIFKRKKMRYMITFVDSINLQDDLKPSSFKVLRFLTKEMNYGNTLKGYGMRDINIATGMNMHYIIKGISELCKMDMIRFSVDKGRREYMVNPVYFYKGSMKKLFYTAKKYDQLPRNSSLK